jgi:outer membrane protein assembly factor BamB
MTAMANQHRRRLLAAAGHWTTVGTIALALFGMVRAAAVATAADAPLDADSAVLLPTDRVKERQLDRLRRLFAEARWSDAAALSDELLESSEDVFVRDQAAATQRSLKSAVAELLARQPPRAREAYDLLFAARAERALREAVAADDPEGVATVARRWLHTPAGRQAAVIMAIAALETGRPAVAAAWLERRQATGDDNGGVERLLARARRRDEVEAWPSAASLAHNPIVAASRPLLAPRYRVPLARDPAEAAALERRRKARADREADSAPSAVPIAIDGTIVTQAPIGLVAVDFESGKRLWVRPRRPLAASIAADPPAGDAAVGMTSGDTMGTGLAAARGLVVVVEPGSAPPATDGFVFPAAGEPGESNTLVACDVATGTDRWRLPTAGSAAWFLGPPLAVGDELLALVEEKGEVRLDAVAVTTGTVNWSQTLAQIDEGLGAGDATGRKRRPTGLTPALADGILVCPLGAGAVVALDMATRTLLWAYHYDLLDAGEPSPGVAGGLPSATRGGDHPPRDGWPVIASGRVLVTPPDSDRLVCLDLRSGTAAWPEHPGGRLRVVGVTGENVVTLGRSGIEARTLVDGSRRWRLGYDEAGGRPSGRGILTSESLMVPLESAEVIEISTATGLVGGRCPARGGAVPGNLVAYRDAILAQGSATLDVFHQIGPLETRVAEALRADPNSSWAVSWRGQLALDRGDVAAGLDALGTAALAPGAVQSPGTLAAAVLAGLDRDFSAAAPAWRGAWRAETEGRSAVPPAARAMVRAAVDGFLDRRVAAEAWEGCRTLLSTAAVAGPDELAPDPHDRALAVTEGRWLGGRLARLVEIADDPLRREIEAVTHAAVEAAADGHAPLAALERLAGMLGPIPAAAAARLRIVAALDAATARVGDPAGRLAARRELHLLALLRLGTPAARAAAAERLAATEADAKPAAEWPLGRVVVRRTREPPAEARDIAIAHRAVAPLTVDHPFLPDLALVHDPQHGSLLVLDRYGRRLVEPLALDAGRSLGGFRWQPLASGPEASCLGRLLVVDGGSTIAAHDLAAAGSGGRCLWSRPRGTPTTRDLGGGPVRRFGGGHDHGGVLLADLLTDAGGPPVARAPRRTVARATGVLHLDGKTLVLLEPSTGRVLWERRRLPAGAGVFGDDEVACVVSADAVAAEVVSMTDGRIVRTTRLPPARTRLGAAGRWLVAVARGAEATARIEMHDPATGDRVALGEIDARSRAVLDATRLVTLDPSGSLVAFALDGRAEVWRVKLPELPSGFDFLHVMPQPGRLLVVAGATSADDGSAAQDGADFFTARPWPPSGDPTRPLTAAVWALDDATGELLWPAPATINGFALHTAQPLGLPLLLFSRSGPPALGAPRQRLELLGLDTRTGHAVFEDGGLPVQGVECGCTVRGDPRRRTIELRVATGGGRGMVLDYTLAPLAPKPPYRSARPRGRADVVLDSLGPATVEPLLDP